MNALRDWTMNSAAEVLGCQPLHKNVRFTGVSIDTRTVANGDLFIAIVGENFDGNDYVATAKENGAVGAVVSRKQDIAFPCLEVEDTRIAIGKLAHAHRLNFKKPVIGLTGSNGKTTVKELLSAILRRGGEVLATKGNFNNDIGLPLTLLDLKLTEDFAVIEMGANHPGEIDYLSKIAHADVAILNNAGAAHLEGFGSIEGVAKAKGEIFQNLGAEGIAVINRDDDFADYWLGITEHCKRVCFGVESAEADVAAKKILHTESGIQFELCANGGAAHISLPLFGKHNVLNALAASAAALSLGVTLQTISVALESFVPVGGRLKSLHGVNGCLVFDDTYNANPSSMKAGIDVVSSMNGDAVLVMGDMLEGGSSSESDHAEIGAYAKEAGVKCLYAFGPHSVAAVKSFGDEAQHFDNHEMLAKELLTRIDENSVILVKGSRGMRMERIVEALVDSKRSA